MYADLSPLEVLASPTPQYFWQAGGLAEPGLFDQWKIKPDARN